jgi:hypothetical protein
VDPAEQVTLSVLLDEGIAHGETCGLLAGGMTAASTRWRWRFSPPAEPEPNPKQR